MAWHSDDSKALARPSSKANLSSQLSDVKTIERCNYQFFCCHLSRSNAALMSRLCFSSEVFHSSNAGGGGGGGTMQNFHFYSKDLKQDAAAKQTPRRCQQEVSIKMESRVTEFQRFAGRFILTAQDLL